MRSLPAVLPSTSQLTPDDPGPTIGDEFVGVTNAEIASVLGESFGGAMVPDSRISASPN